MSALFEAFIAITILTSLAAVLNFRSAGILKPLTFCIIMIGLGALLTLAGMLIYEA